MILVSYIDSEFDRLTLKVKKVKKYGLWHKGKVILWDKEKTTVRNWAWVKLANPFKVAWYFIEKINIKISFKIIYIK